MLNRIWLAFFLASAVAAVLRWLAGGHADVFAAMVSELFDMARLSVEIMVLLFGIAPHTAVGTDLWFAAITKMVGGWVHGKRGTVDWEVLRRMFYGSIPAAILTLLWLHLSGSGQSHSTLMLKTLGGVLILTSVAAVFGIAEATAQMRGFTNDFAGDRTGIFIMFALGYIVIVEAFSFLSWRLERRFRAAAA